MACKRIPTTSWCNLPVGTPASTCTWTSRDSAEGSRKSEVGSRRPEVGFRKRAALIACGFAFVLFSSISRAEDTVLVSSSDDQRGTRYSGEIVEYTGRELRLKNSLGKERAIPAERVISFATTWSQDHLAGDKLFG